MMLILAIIITGIGASLTVGMKIVPNPADGLASVINLWRKTHTLACGMKATFHLINT